MATLWLQVYKLISDDISSSKSVTTISADIKDYEVYFTDAGTVRCNS